MPEFLVNALAALLGALTAGAIGFFFAVRRFQHERIFERRLAWHETTVQRLTEASEALRRAAVTMQIPDLEEDSEDTFQRALGTVPSIAVLLSEAQMYASRKSFKALSHASTDWAELALASVQILNTGDALDESDAAKQISPKVVEAVAKSMRHAAHRLASDVRDVLKLGVLDDADTLYDDKQVKGLDRDGFLTALDRAKRIRNFPDAP